MTPNLLQSVQTPKINDRFHRLTGAASIARIIRQLPLTILVVATLTGLGWASSGPDAGKPKPAADYGKVPLSFEPNRGQTDPHVQFFSRGQGYGIFLAPAEAVLSRQKPAAGAGKTTLGKDGKPIATPAPEASVLRMTLEGANPTATATPQNPLPGTSNYLLGNNAKNWATDVPTFEKVNFNAVYPGIDLVYYGNQRQLEYDFVVAPNADPKKIALNFTGATPRLDANGDLQLANPGGETSFYKPVVYQMAGDTRVLVDAAYVIAKQEVRFSLGAYDHSKPLVIDPILSYGTFLGGSLDDRGFGVQVDSAGNAYLMGDTVSLNLPLFNAYQSTNHNTSNGWVVDMSKLNPTGTALIYSTFLGDIADSHGLGLAIDSAGNASIAGYTAAGDYPVTGGAFQTQCGSNSASVNNVLTRVSGCGPSSGTSAFLTKLAPAGNALVYSTFLGGNGFTGATSVAINAAGEAYIAGNTNSSCGAGPYYPAPFANHVEDCFPASANSYQTMINGAFAPGAQIWGFVTKFSANGSSLLYSTLFAAPNHTAPSGGALTNIINAVAVDTSGNAYATGYGGYGLPTTPSAFNVPPANSSTVLPPYPAYVAKFNPTLSGSASLVYSTFLGSAVQTANGSNYASAGTSMVADASGDAIVAGYNNVCGFPTTVGAYQPSFATSGNGSTGCQDGFVTKLNPTGTGLIWSTLLGSGRNASTTNTTANALALGANGNVYVALNAGGGTFPLVQPLRSAVSGGSVIAELDATGSNLLFSSYLGSYGTSGYGGTDVATGVAVDPAGNMYITGRMDANTLTIPTTTGALQTTYQGGSYDAFVLKIAPTITSATTLTVPTGTVTAGQSTAFSATVAGPTGITTVPTGTVTFFSGSTTLGTGMLNGSGVATYTATSLNATTYNLTASYPGDTNFAGSVSSAKALVVSPATATLTLTVPATAVVGASVALAVTVTGSGGTPSGTVVFKDGATTLSTVTLASGAASFSTTALAVGAHSITASYSGDSIFGFAVSAAQTLTINVAPGDSFTALPTALSIVHGANGTVVITGTPVGGYIGTASFACGPLPSSASRTFAPSTMVFTGNNTAQTTTLTIATSLTVTGANHPPSFGTAQEIFVALLLVPLGFVRLRRNVSSGLKLTLLLLLLTTSSAAFLGLAGCSSGSTTPKTTTTTAPAGAYSIAITVTAPSANTTLTIPVTVQQGCHNNRRCKPTKGRPRGPSSYCVDVFSVKRPARPLFSPLDQIFTYMESTRIPPVIETEGSHRPIASSACLEFDPGRIHFSSLPIEAHYDSSIPVQIPASRFVFLLCCLDLRLGADPSRHLPDVWWRRQYRCAVHE